MAPKDENELQLMLYTALHHSGPVVVRYPRGNGEGIPLETEMRRLPIGKGEILQEGEDLLLLPIGNRVYPALAAAKRLEELGISAAVLNPRFLKPLDKELISRWATRTGRVLTIEDNSASGGFGSAVLQMLNEQGLHLPVKILGYSDGFIEQGPQATLWRDAAIDAEGIVRKALSFLNKG